jgi:hypothetical protein
VLAAEEEMVGFSETIKKPTAGERMKIQSDAQMQMALLLHPYPEHVRL